MKLLKLAPLAAALVLAGCGGSDDNDSTSNPTDTKASFTLGVSDAPVSDVKEVWVAFDSITLNGGDGNMPTFDTPSADDPSAPTMVNLLEYTGDDIFTLLNDEELEAGEYEWLRADIVNGDMSNITMTSHLVYNDDTIVPLIVTRKGNDGIGEIQMNDFTLAVGDNDFVLEFDLKKSLVNPSNSEEVVLKPTGIRLENLAEVEDIEGTVSETLMQNCETDNMSLAPESGSFGHAVYLYAGDTEMPADLSSEGDVSGANAPIATAQVMFDEEDGEWEYEIAFVSADDYQVGYTCTAHIDDAELVDADFSLYQTQAVTVTAGEDAEVNFDIAQ